MSITNSSNSQISAADNSRTKANDATIVVLTSSSAGPSQAEPLHGESRKSSAGILRRRQANTTISETALPHLALDFENLQGSLSPPSKGTPESVPNDCPTASIAVPPARTTALDRPITPLSGRPRGLSTFETAAFQTSNVRRYSSSSSASQGSSSMSASPMQRQPPASGATDSRRRAAEQAAYGRVSSPLSPSKPTPIPRSGVRQRPRRPQQSLEIAGLPKFHPANFHNTDSQHLLPSQTRHLTSAARRHGSDAQQRLHQHQRDVVSSFKKSTFSPCSPKLGPQGSPGLSITPLALESSGDYLSAGSGLSPSTAKNSRELVEKLVSKENERRNHPEARPGSMSPAVSPNVSPAVSPAGGGR